MLRFSANLEFLFGEVPFIDRFEAAAAAGFRAVEIHFVGGRDRGAIEAALARTGLVIDAMNVDCGDFAAGERGFAADPARRAEFRASIDRAIEDAARFRIPRMHILLGRRDPAVSRTAQLGSAAVNLAWAADRLEAAGRIGLIELLNPLDNPGYILESMTDVLGLLDAVGSANLRIQFDVYHLQRVQGELIRTFEHVRDRIGHIQIADAPGRNEPGSGEIDYRTILAAIDAAGYDGYVGLEYRPLRSTVESLAWIESYGYTRGG